MERQVLLSRRTGVEKTRRGRWHNWSGQPRARPLTMAIPESSASQPLPCTYVRVSVATVAAATRVGCVSLSSVRAAAGMTEYTRRKRKKRKSPTTAFCELVAAFALCRGLYRPAAASCSPRAGCGQTVPISGKKSPSHFWCNSEDIYIPEPPQR